MHRRLTLITGVARTGQVGEAVARTFAEHGDALVLVSRSEPDVQARAAALRSAGFDVTAYGCDLADEAAVDALARRVGDERGRDVAVLVNLAGGFAVSGRVAESTAEVWDRMARVNLLTAYHATHCFLPHLRRTQGSIVYFASVVALPGATGAEVWAYAAAKGAVTALMRAVAAEERNAGVRANAVAPSTIRTDANVRTLGDGPRYVEREAVADAVWYLSSDEARAVTGQVVRLG